jgi:hypothetical protein
MTLAQQAALIEEAYSANQYSGLSTAEAVLAVHGSIPLLLTAPHAVNHLRNGSIKIADTFTGALVHQLCELTGAFGLILQRTTQEDPNFDAHGLFKDALSSIVAERRIQYLLDLHGMARSQQWDIAIGTAGGVTLGKRQDILDTLIDSFHAEGLNELLVNDPAKFSARNPNTIAHFTWRTMAIPAMQIEIQRDYRDPAQYPAKYDRIVKALATAIDVMVRSVSVEC